jgi:hypothetical protein
MKQITVTLLLAALTLSATAEIYKVAIPDERCGTICFYWWPVLPAVDGWRQDMPNSFHYSANTQAPVGESFSNAESVIYAKAIYKPSTPDTKSLNQLIEDDKKDFKQSSDPLITKIEPLTTSDGNELLSYQFFPRDKGNYERVSYGEEGEFYLVFTLSSRSKKGYESTMSAYMKFIEQYREKP